MALLNKPGAIIAILANRLRVFNHTRPAAPSKEGVVSSKPLEEIPGTKASMEADIPVIPQGGSGENKG